MLRLLLFLSVVGLGASQLVNFPSCSINYFGTVYNQAYVSLSAINQVYICFERLFDMTDDQDCIKGPFVDGGSMMTYSNTTADSTMIAEYQAGLPSIPDSLECVVTFFMTINLQDAFIRLGKLGSRSAVSADVVASGLYRFELQIGGVTKVDFDVISSVQVFEEVSKCVSSGILYPPGFEIMSLNSTTCSMTICNSLAQVETIGCASMQHCDNGVCVFTSPCTVTGPGVIDFSNNNATVGDRCKYTLLSAYGVTITGQFKDRRREDIALLSKLEIEISGTTLEISDDGRVQADGSELTLTSTPQSALNGTISKDNTGITLSLSVQDFTIIIFYNGNFAQISFSANQPGAVMTGLCTDASSQTISRVSLLTDSCLDMKSQDPDDTIDCSAVQADCMVMASNPLIACGDVDADPYIALCNDIMCKYPQLDGFVCPFHEAYSRACSLSGSSQGDWRSLIGCDDSVRFCHGKTCIHDEFCGDTEVGTRGCLCRAVFAHQFKPDTCGDDPVCRDNLHSASVTLVGCLLEKRGFDFRNLHLIDSSCTGQVDDATKTVTLSFDDNNRCGAEVSFNRSDSLVIGNTVSNSDYSSIITMEDQLLVNFSCFFVDPETLTSGFNVIDNSVVKTLRSGQWTYILNMKAYTDAALTMPVAADTDVMLKEIIWVKLTTSGLEGAGISLFTDSCWATTQESSSLRYDLITDGCSDSMSVNVMGNGMGLSNCFSFPMFQFNGFPGKVHLHCKVKLCDGDCIPSCGLSNRRRRSTRMKFLTEDPAIISLVWTA